MALTEKIVAAILGLALGLVAYQWIFSAMSIPLLMGVWVWVKQALAGIAAFVLGFGAFLTVGNDLVSETIGFFRKKIPVLNMLP